MVVMLHACPILDRRINISLPHRDVVGNGLSYWHAPDCSTGRVMAEFHHYDTAYGPFVSCRPHIKRALCPKTSVHPMSAPIPHPGEIQIVLSQYVDRKTKQPTRSGVI